MLIVCDINCVPVVLFMEKDCSFSLAINTKNVEKKIILLLWCSFSEWCAVGSYKNKNVVQWLEMVLT